MTQKKTFEEMIGAFKALGNSFRLEYDVDYGIDRKTGWSVVIDGSVVVQFADTPEEALQKALDRWDRIPDRIMIEKIQAILEDNPCHHRHDGPDPDCVLCLIRSALGNHVIEKLGKGDK